MPGEPGAGGVESLSCADLDVFVDICQRIRAGWLPYRNRVGQWLWGRPGRDGFQHWSTGQTPQIYVRDPMTDNEIRVWRASLNVHAQELVDG